MTKAPFWGYNGAYKNKGRIFMMRKTLQYILWLVLAPLSLLAGYLLAGDRGTAFAVGALVVLSLLPFFLRFEKAKHSAAEITVLAALVAFAAVSRMAFFALPGVKPITAVAVLAGVFFGKEAGFATGSLSALLSGLAFGIGGFTPFQMLSWGFCGLLAGLLAPLLKQLVPLLIYGGASGILFSLVMDLWVVLTAEGGFSLSRFAAATATSLPFTLLYALTNILFLALMRKPVTRIFGRLQRKYGIFHASQER